ncbi:hypothetical protein PAPHI01_1925 [Pancytospora philotis]|nr:hypothetical protein PAPHI01_1925 [Pancytospora philotis]
MRLNALVMQTFCMATAVYSHTENDAVFSDRYNTQHAEIGRSLQNAFETCSELAASISQLCKEMSATILEPWMSVAQENISDHEELIAEIGGGYKAFEARALELQHNYESALGLFDGIFKQVEKLQNVLIDYVAKNRVAFTANRPAPLNLAVPSSTGGPLDKYLEGFRDRIRKPFKDLHKVLYTREINFDDSAVQRGISVAIVNETLLRSHTIISKLLFIVFDLHDVLEQNNVC